MRSRIFRLRKPVLFFGLLLFLFSCSEEKEKVDVPFSAVENKYASYFKIYKRDRYTLLVTFLNAEKTDSAVYALFKGEKPELQSEIHGIQIPVQNVACLSSVFVGFLNRLEAISAIRAVDNMDFVSNQQLLDLSAKGSIKELAKNGPLNIEQTLTCGVNVLFTNPTGDKKKDIDARLLGANITPVVCADYFENHPLGRAEWVKAMSLFFGKEEMADSLFAETERKYFALKASVDTVSYKPTVFTELKTNDTWFVAGGKSSLAQFLADAGADYLWKDNGKVNVTALNMEQVIEKALNADYWINLHLSNMPSEILEKDKRYGEFKAFKTRNLFNNNRRLNLSGGNDYWETGLCNPDEILADLVNIFHPDLQPVKELKYYKQLK